MVWLSNRAFQFSKLLLMNTGNEVGQMAREGNGVGMTKVVSRIFRTFGLAERHPALARAVSDERTDTHDGVVGTDGFTCPPPLAGVAI